MNNSLHDYDWMNYQFRWVFDFDVRMSMVTRLARDLFKTQCSRLHSQKFEITEEVWSMMNTRSCIDNALKEYKIHRVVPNNLC